MTAVVSDEVRLLVLTERDQVPPFLGELARSTRYRPVGRSTSMADAIDVVGERATDVVVAEIVTLQRLGELAEAVGAGAMEPARVVVVSSLPAELALVTCMGAGARGFLHAPLEPGLLEQAVTAVAAGHTFVDTRSTAVLVAFAIHGHRARPWGGLTLRQAQVMRLVRGGFTNRQIAAALGVSTETVKSHLQEAMRRLGVHDRRTAASAESLREEE